MDEQNALLGQLRNVQKTLNTISFQLGLLFVVLLYIAFK
jgi:hypothetical protein